MADKPTKAEKAAVINILRNRAITPKVIVPKSFHIRAEPETRTLLQILLEPRDKAARPERITFDGTFALNNPRNISNYLGALQGIEPEEEALDPNTPYAPESAYANLVFLGRVGERAETTFLILSYQEWAVGNRDAKPGHETIVEADPILSVYSTTAFQIKLLSEILLALKVKNNS